MILALDFEQEIKTVIDRSFDATSLDTDSI